MGFYFKVDFWLSYAWVFLVAGLGKLLCYVGKQLESSWVNSYLFLILSFSSHLYIESEDDQMPVLQIVL